LTTVRRATAADRPALEALWAAFMAEQATLDPRVAPAPDAGALWRATLADLLRDAGAAVFVAEGASGVAGFLVAEPHAAAPVYAPVRAVHLTELYVAPDARRQGMATALLDAAAAWAEGAGAVRLHMDVLWANAPSRRLVERWGGAPFAVAFTRDLGGQAP